MTRTNIHPVTSATVSLSLELPALHPETAALQAGCLHLAARSGSSRITGDLCTKSTDPILLYPYDPSASVVLRDEANEVVLDLPLKFRGAFCSATKTVIVEVGVGASVRHYPHRRWLIEGTARTTATSLALALKLRQVEEVANVPGTIEDSSAAWPANDGHRLLLTKIDNADG